MASIVITALAILLLGCQPALAVAAEATRPNVLFIAVDDLNTRIGAYGDPIAKTPNLDRLARQGVRFERAYSQFPLCSPSRASLLLGRYPTTTETVDFSRVALLGRDWITLPQLFRQNDYEVRLVGKIFHDVEPAPWSAGEKAVLREQAIHRQMIADLTRWEPFRMLTPPPASTQDDLTKLTNVYRPATTAEEHQASPEPYSWGADVHNAKQAVDLLTQWASSGRAFFLGLGFYKPHVPLVAPKRFFDLYPPGTIPLPQDFAPIPRVKQDVPVYALRPNLEVFFGERATAERAREAIAAYYACISFMDEQLGQVLNALQRLGLDQNTIIVLWGDHGWHLGEKGMWGKGTLFEVSTRVPLIIVDPRKATAGQVSPRAVELVDVYPTVVQLTGLPMPPGLEGESLAPLLDNPRASWDTPALSLVAREDWLGRSVCTEQWCYIEWDEARRGAELYDLRADPEQTRNLAKESKYTGVVSKLAEVLHAGPVARPSPVSQIRWGEKPPAR